MIHVRNDHVGINALSILVSQTDMQLVAALLFGTEKVSMNAIKAELEKSSGRPFLRLSGDAGLWVNGARMGFTNLWATLEKVNAHGYLLAMQHRYAGDPRLLPAKQHNTDDTNEAKPYFYVVTTVGENLEAKFIERLQLAIPWAVQPEWGPELLKLGTDMNLVEPLYACTASELKPMLESDPELQGVAFQGGLRVVKDADAWGDLITSCIEQEFIHI